jgi:hypothetical protein
VLRPFLLLARRPSPWSPRALQASQPGSSCLSLASWRPATLKTSKIGTQLGKDLYFGSKAVSSPSPSLLSLARPSYNTKGDKENGAGKKKKYFTYHFPTFKLYIQSEKFKSLTQLGTMAKQNCDKIELKTHAPILRITQKVPTFSEIIIFTDKNAVLEF